MLGRPGWGVPHRPRRDPRIRRPSALRVAAGTPVVTARIGNRSARCIFDTGAQFGFLLDGDLAEGARSDGTIDDFSPIIGAIRSDAWRVRVALGSVQFEERCGLLTGVSATALTMFGVDAIIGCSWLPNRTVWYRPHAGELALSPLA